MLGYQVTTVATIITDIREHIDSQLNSPFLPGEGNAVLELLQHINQYLMKKSDLLPFIFWDTSAIEYLYAVDAVQSMPPLYIFLDVINV